MSMAMYALLGADAATGTLGAFTTTATEMLTWLITSMGTILGFMFSNTACLIGLCVALCISAIGIIKHMIG